MAAQDPPPSARAEAGAYISRDSFHKKFTVPATASHGALTFSYSDVGVSLEEQSGATQAPVVVFHPGLFASRYVGVHLHALAKHLGIRVLTVDRYAKAKYTEMKNVASCS